MPTPLDTLNNLKGKQVTVEKKDKSIVKGKLTAFDLNINLSIETSEGLEFVNGASVNMIFQEK